MSCWVDAYILQECIYATILLGNDGNRYGLLSMLHSPICTLLQLAVSLANCNHAASGMFLVTSCGAYYFSSLWFFFLQMECTCMARVVDMFLCIVVFG